MQQWFGLNLVEIAMNSTEFKILLFWKLRRKTDPVWIKGHPLHVALIATIGGTFKDFTDVIEICCKFHLILFGGGSKTCYVTRPNEMIFLGLTKRPSLHSLITLLKRSHEYGWIAERSRDFADLAPGQDLRSRKGTPNLPSEALFNHQSFFVWDNKADAICNKTSLQISQDTTISKTIIDCALKSSFCSTKYSTAGIYAKQL